MRWSVATDDGERPIAGHPHRFGALASTERGRQLAERLSAPPWRCSICRATPTSRRAPWGARRRRDLSPEGPSRRTCSPAWCATASIVAERTEDRDDVADAWSQPSRRRGRTVSSRCAKIGGACALFAPAGRPSHRDYLVVTVAGQRLSCQRDRRAARSVRASKSSRACCLWRSAHT